MQISGICEEGVTLSQNSDRTQLVLRSDTKWGGGGCQIQSKSIGSLEHQSKKNRNQNIAIQPKKKTKQFFFFLVFGFWDQREIQKRMKRSKKGGTPDRKYRIQG